MWDCSWTEGRQAFLKISSWVCCVAQIVRASESERVLPLCSRAQINFMKFGSTESFNKLWLSHLRQRGDLAQYDAQTLLLASVCMMIRPFTEGRSPWITCTHYPAMGVTSMTLVSICIAKGWTSLPQGGDNQFPQLSPVGGFILQYI